MKRMFVYILLCNDNSYYTGVTNDLERRFAEHQQGINKKSYTHSRRPVKLIFVKEFPDPNQAIAFEKQVKGWSRAKKEALMTADWNELKRLSKNYTEYGSSSSSSE